LIDGTVVSPGSLQQMTTAVAASLPGCARIRDAGAYGAQLPVRAGRWSGWTRRLGMDWPAGVRAPRSV